MPLTAEQQADLDRKRGMTVVPSRTSEDAPWYTQVDWNTSTTNDAARYERMNRSKAAHQRLVRLGQIASVAPFAVAGGAALAAGGGASAAGASASVPGVVGASSAPLGGGTVAAGTSFASRLPWLKLSEIGVGAGMDLWGQHNANRANDRAMQMDLAAQKYYQQVMEKQIALDRERFDADQEQNRLDRVASEDERAYTRTLSEGRERRRGPYRAVGQAALMSLADIAHLRPRY